MVFCSLLIASGNAKALDIDAPEQQDEKKRVDLRFGIGGTFMSGFQDVADFYMDAYDIDIPVIPIGVDFKATVQISHGNWIASIPSFGIGPVGLVLTQEEVYGYGYSSSFSTLFVDVPITGTYGLKFLPHGSVGPYVRGGVAYHATFGNVVASKSPGAFVGAGVEFLQNRRASIAVEAAYDDSTVTFKGISSYLGSAPPTKIKTGAALLSVRVVF
jgi:hypothetical protein